MKLKLIILTALVVAGCESKVWRTVPTTDSEREAVRKMVLDLCAASNPYSDEEPEDMIIQAEKTACAVLCKPTPWTWNGSSYAPVIEEAK
jgi:hypothetical protein